MHLVWPPDQAGVIGEEALESLYAYPSDRPWLAANFVSSVDGAVEVAGRSGCLSNSPDRRVLRLGSDFADVVMVGATTAMVENFRGVHPDQIATQRRRRHALAPIPATAVVTTGSLPANAPVITEAIVPTIVLTCASAPEDTRKAWTAGGAHVVIAGDQTVELDRAIQALTERGLCRFDCEGGPTLFGALLVGGLVDELRLTISPLTVSGKAGRIAAGAPIDPITMRLATVLVEEDVLLLRYLTHRC